MRGDHVHLAFDHHDRVLVDRGLFGLVEREHQLALVVHVGLGRVHVLGRLQSGVLLRVADDPPRESADHAGAVRDRDHQPSAEPRVRTAFAGDHQAGFIKFGRGESFLLERVHQRVVIVRRVPDPELLRRLLLDAAPLQVVLRHLPARMRQRRHEVFGRLFVGFEQALLGLGSLRVEPFQFHAGPLGQHAQRLGEVGRLALHHELEDVAALAATEAVERLTFRIHDERRGLLLVERTEPFEVPSGFLERYGFADQLDDVQP